MAKLKAINVIEILDDHSPECRTFTRNKEGWKQAERYFRKLHKEHNDPDGTTGYERPTKKEFKHMILDGVYDDDCGYKIYIQGIQAYDS